MKLSEKMKNELEETSKFMKTKEIKKLSWSVGSINWEIEVR